MVTDRPLRIAHAISAPAAGGAEIYVKDLAVELVRRGHRPLILFVSRAGDAGFSAAFERDYLAQLEAAGIDYAFIGHGCRFNPALGAWRVRRLCRGRGVDLYHSHLKYALLFGALLRVPRVHTHHNIRAHAPRWMYPLFDRLVDAWVGISDVCGARLETFVGHGAHIICNAVDAGRIGAGGTEKRAENGDFLRCIAVGRIGEQKNFSALIEALKLVGAEGRTKLHVTIVGEGTAADTAALARRIEQAGLGATVTLLGNRADVPALLRTADLFLMTSAWEGLPIALLEATMAGLPFIASDVGGCPEVAARCGNGIIVPVNDPAALARELLRLMGDPALRARLAEAARDNGGAFAIGPCVEQHLALYRSLIAAAAAAPR